MALADIIASVKSMLEDVAGIVNVYDYERTLVTPSEFQAVYGDSNGRIHAWTISRQSSPENMLTNKQNVRPHVLLIRGYMEIIDPDATAKTFRALVEAVATAFRPTRDLGGNAELLGPAQVDQGEEPHLFADSILVHYAEIRLTAQERITV